MDTKADELQNIEKSLRKEGGSMVIMDPGIRVNPSHNIYISSGKVRGPQEAH